MIIEDEDPFQELYAAILEDTDYEIIRAYDGDDALVVLERKHPDLIILDILLNMVTGDTLFLYLKSMPKYADIPIIIVTSASKHSYKNLIKMDPELVFLDKTMVTESLITEIKAKIG
jgi:CheY-like chemotaxis protein